MRNREFSIISDDCWAGPIYRELGLAYMTPFVGLYIHLSEYLELLSDLKNLLNHRLEFIATEKPFPVARLGDVRLFFMHYESREEAAAKWYGR